MRFAPTFYRVEIKFWNTQNRHKTANSSSPILKNWVNLGQKWPRSEKSRRILRRLQMGGVLRCEADQNISIRECFDSLLVSIKSCFGTEIPGIFHFCRGKSYDPISEQSMFVILFIFHVSQMSILIFPRKFRSSSFYVTVNTMQPSSACPKSVIIWFPELLLITTNFDISFAKEQENR